MTKSADEIADAFFGAIERGNVDVVAALYSRGVQVWHNFTGVAQTGEENIAFLRAFNERIDHLQIKIAGRDHFPGGFVQRHTLCARFKSGAEITAPTCMVVYLQDSKIDRVFEYLDPASARSSSRAK